MIMYVYIHIYIHIINIYIYICCFYSEIDVKYAHVVFGNVKMLVHLYVQTCMRRQCACFSPLCLWLVVSGQGAGWCSLEESELLIGIKY